MKLTPEQKEQNVAALRALMDGNMIEFLVGDVWIKTSSICKDLPHRPIPLPSAPRPWSNPEHVPGPVCWIRKLSFEAMITHIISTGFFAGSHGYVEFVASLDYEHSTDRKSWHPCTVTE